jgi:hypothetical protein
MSLLKTESNCKLIFKQTQIKIEQTPSTGCNLKAKSPTIQGKLSEKKLYRVSDASSGQPENTIIFYLIAQ